MFFTDVRVVRPDGTRAARRRGRRGARAGARTSWPATGDDPERTAEVLVDGWYHTGDAGSLDDEGFLYIRDRYKDMIISGGENVYPAEVESALLELPGVVEAAVIGVPGRDVGRGRARRPRRRPTPAATPTAGRVAAALRERLAGFKVPRRVEFADELPKTATGKIRKPDLRTRFLPPA